MMDIVCTTIKTYLRETQATKFDIACNARL